MHQNQSRYGPKEVELNRQVQVQLDQQKRVQCSEPAKHTLTSPGQGYVNPNYHDMTGMQGPGYITSLKTEVNTSIHPVESQQVASRCSTYIHLDSEAIRAHFPPHIQTVICKVTGPQTRKWPIPGENLSRVETPAHSWLNYQKVL